ncbi:hypothetical protein [Streptomyces broussonetiae]|uniref:hypothetical protein n=1 Tax=Streptomyces broussonetiae TaxID=2686304 RepID=UPI0035DE92F5
MPDASGTLVVDFSALMAAVKAAGAAAGKAQRAAADSQDAMARSGPTPWGDDPGLGQAFGDAFAQPRAGLVNTVQELPALLQQLADNLDASRRLFARAEDSAVEAVTDLARVFADPGAASS